MVFESKIRRYNLPRQGHREASGERCIEERLTEASDGEGIQRPKLW